MYRVLIVLFTVCMSATSAARELETSSPLKAGGDIESYRLQDYPSIDRVVRAHLAPDGPPIENDIPINHHHFRRLTALSLHDQSLRSFHIFEELPLNSLRMYSCHVEDFNSVSIGCLYGCEELHIRNCQIKDISILAKLSGPTSLSLTDNHIVDISPLSRSRRLTWLDLRNNRIESVSALRQLRTLKYVDLRDNPLEADSNDADIRAIKANNPGVRILLGKQSDASRAQSNKLLSARAKIAEIALCGRFQYEGELAAPLLPKVSDEISEALACLRKGDDKEYLADIAALLVKFSIDLMSFYRPGPASGPGDEPFVDAFIDEVGLKVRLEGINVVSIADWICDNRDRLAPSFYLDDQIERYNFLLLELKQKGIFGSNGEPQGVR